MPKIESLKLWKYRLLLCELNLPLQKRLYEHHSGKLVVFRCPAVLWRRGSCVDSMSSKTSLNASFIVMATLVRFHSLRIFHKQSIRWALICTSCSTEQPTVCSVNCWCNCSTYWWSTTRDGGGSSLLRRDWMLVCWCEGCLACISNNGTWGSCCPCRGCSFRLRLASILPAILWVEL